MNDSRESLSYRWAALSLVLLALVALLGFLAFLFAREALGNLIAPLILIGVVGLGFCLFRLIRVVEVDPNLTDVERHKFRRSIQVFGPLGALELLLHLRKSRDR